MNCQWKFPIEKRMSVKRLLLIVLTDENGSCRLNHWPAGPFDGAVTKQQQQQRSVAELGERDRELLVCIWLVWNGDHYAGDSDCAPRLHRLWSGRLEFQEGRPSHSSPVSGVWLVGWQCWERSRLVSVELHHQIEPVSGKKDPSPPSCAGFNLLLLYILRLMPRGSRW